MKQWELDRIYEAIDQLEAHASVTIGSTAHTIATKANFILEKVEIEAETDSDLL
jgi:hypothetical protein